MSLGGLATREDEQDAHIVGRDARDARCLTDGAGTDAVELLASLGTEGLDFGVVKPLGDEDVLQTLELLGLLPFALDVATVLDEDFGTFGDFLTACRDGLEGTTEGRHHLAQVGEGELRAQDEVDELASLTQGRDPSRL